MTFVLIQWYSRKRSRLSSDYNHPYSSMCDFTARWTPRDAGGYEISSTLDCGFYFGKKKFWDQASASAAGHSIQRHSVAVSTPPLKPTQRRIIVQRMALYARKDKYFVTPWISMETKGLLSTYTHTHPKNPLTLPRHVTRTYVYRNIDSTSNSHPPDDMHWLDMDSNESRSNAHLW